MLRGIDVSIYDGFNGRTFKANTERAYQESDFVIVKATQGTGYVNASFQGAYQRAKRDGKLLGVYHYASGGNARAEAEYFVSHARGCFGEAIPVLDWEQIQNRSWGSTTWCRAFCDRVHELTGVWPMVYVQASARYQAASCADVCALWIAGYPDERNNWNVPTFRYGTSPWGTWTVWQYSSSGGATDRDVAQLDRAGWLRIAGASAGSTSNEEDIVTDQDIQKIAEKVWQYAIGGTQARDRLQGIDGIVQGLRDQRKPSTMLLMTPTHDGQPLGYLAWWDGSELRMLGQEHQPLAIQKVAAEMGQDCASVYIEDNWFYRFVTAVGCKDAELVRKAQEFFPSESIA